MWNAINKNFFINQMILIHHLFSRSDAFKKLQNSPPKAGTAFPHSHRLSKSSILSMKESNELSSSIDVGISFNIAWHFLAIHCMTHISLPCESWEILNKPKCPIDFRWYGGVAHKRKVDIKAKDGLPFWWMYSEYFGQELKQCMSSYNGIKHFSFGLSSKRNP